MKRQMILCLLLLLACATTSFAQSSSKFVSSTKGSIAETDIRKVDFQNFTYNSSLCSMEYGKKGIGKVVRVKNGEFKHKSVYFAVAVDRIVYADVSGDGSEDAIVPVECGATGANFSRSEVNIYTIKAGRATLLGQTNDKAMEKDYRANYADADGYWGINENGIKVSDGNLVVEVLVDGPHASPKYIATLEYHYDGKALRLKGKPQRRNYSQ